MSANQSTHSAVSKRYALYVLVLLHTVQVFAYLDRYGLAIVIEQIRDEFEVSDAWLGFLQGPAFAIFYAIAGFPIARMADLYPRRTVLSVSLAVWSGMTALCGVAGAFWHLALARIGVGVGEAGGTPPSHSLVVDYFGPATRGKAMAFVTAGSMVGGLIANAGGAILAENFGWRVTFVVLGLPGILFALLLFFTLREPPRGRFDSVAARSGSETTLEVAKYFWGLPSFRLLTMAMGMASLTGYGVTFWLAPFFLRVHEMNLVDVGVGLGIATLLGSGGGTLLSGYLVDRFGNSDPRWFMRIPALGMLIGFPIQLMVFLWPHPLVAMAMLIPSGMVGSTWAAPSYTTAQIIVKPHMRALAASVLLFALNVIGVGLGSWLVGILNDQLAPSFGEQAVRYSLVALSALNLLTALVYLAASRYVPTDLRRRDQEG